MKTYLQNLFASDHQERTEVRDWKILHQLSIKLLHPDTLRQKLTHILDTVASFHGTIKAVISILEPTSPTFSVKASTGMDEAAVAALSQVRPGEGCCGYAFTHRRRIIVEDFAKSDVFADFRPWAQQNKIGAVYSTPFYDAVGEPLGALSVYFDKPHTPSAREIELTDMCASTVALIIDRDMTETALRAERDRRDEILDSMGEGFCIVDKNFIVIEMNAAAVEMNCRPLHEMLGRSHWELWPDTNDSEVGRMYRKAMSERIQISLENRWEDPLGNVGWFHLTAIPINAGLALYIRDVTERKKAQQLVVDSEERYRALSECVSDVVWRSDANGMAVHDVPSWGRYSGQTREEYAGSGWADRIHPDDREGYIEAFNRSIAEGTPCHFAVRLLRHDGQYRHMLIRGVPLRNEAGEIYEWVGNCEDVSEMLAVQEQLQLADKRKDEFLAVLSHELRSPISAAKMAAQLLEAPAITSERAKQMGQVIARQVGHMSRLVEDLIDVSRVARGLIRLEKSRVDLGEVIRSAVEQIRPMIIGKDHTLSVVTMSDEQPVFVTGDRTRLIQVVTNLLSNATRYTPAGGHITISLATNARTVQIKVIDNGIGISPDVMANLFDLFVQAEVSTDRKNGGLGLGLALVKSLVDLHQGSVIALSDGTDLGSTFVVELPLGEPAPPDRPSPSIEHP